MSFKSVALKDSPGWFYDHLETSGTDMLDASGNGADGVYVGSPTLNQRSLTFLPHEGRSVLFSGATRATVPAGIVTTTTYTYEFLIRPEAVSGVQCLAHDGSNGLYINNGKFSFYYSSAYHDADTALVAGNKYLLHLVVTAGEVEFLVNRVSDGTASSAPIFNSTTLFAEDGGGNELNVSACISACYPGLALTGLKIRNRYREAFSVGFRKVIANSAPYIHLPMAETVGNTNGFDVSGNDLDGTYSNVTLNQAAMLHQMRGGSALFDGASGHLVVSDNATIQNVFDGGGAAGILLNATSDGEGSEGRLLDKNGWHIAVIGESVGAAKIQFTQLFSTTNGVWETTATDLTLANDECVLIEYDNADVANDPIIYIAGVSVALTETSSPTGTRTTDVGSDLYIGNNAAGSATFDGRLSNGFIAPTFTANEPLQINEAFRSRYAAEVISYEPTGYWRGNEASGSVIDYGSGANNGTVTGATLGSMSSPLVNHTSDTAIVCDGTSDYVDMGDTNDAGTSDFTVLVWSNLTAAAGQGQRIFDKRGTAAVSSNFPGVQICTDNSGTLGSLSNSWIQVSANNHIQGPTTDLSLYDSEWHFVSVSFNNSLGVADWFHNGASIGAGSTSGSVAGGSISNARPLRLGAASNDETAQEANGGISNAAIFLTQLTSEQILDIYEMASHYIPFGITGLITESLPATEFFVRASQLDTGAFIADAVVQGDNTYTLNFNEVPGYNLYPDEVLLTCLPKTGKRRLNNTAYAVGDYYLPADVTANNHIYKVTVAGTTAASEPTLDQAGGTATDGGVTVQDMGVCPTPMTQISYAETIEL